MTRGMVLPSHAAEKHKGTREVLKHVSGLNDDTIYRDAASPQAGEAERMHTYMISPECNAFSRRRHGRDATTMAHGAADTAAVMPYVMAARADIVVVENVDEPDAVAAITTILQGATAYGWRSQRLDPTDFGLPVSRSRRYFVGVLQKIAPWWEFRKPNKKMGWRRRAVVRSTLRWFSTTRPRAMLVFCAIATPCPRSPTSRNPFVRR